MSHVIRRMSHLTPHLAQTSCEIRLDRRVISCSELEAQVRELLEGVRLDEREQGNATWHHCLQPCKEGGSSCPGTPWSEANLSATAPEGNCSRLICPTIIAVGSTLADRVVAALFRVQTAALKKFNELARK